MSSNLGEYVNYRNNEKWIGKSAACAAILVLGLSGCDAVDDALDPDCTAESAARNVAMQSTIGVGNRCGPGETVRDMTGTDGMVEDAREALP